MENTPLISVVLSTYNDENYIVEAVNSILNQTVTDFELIIIDDCSTDKTVQIIKSIKDDRIKLYENAVNVGLTKNLNKALKLCKGQFIARMDGDDISDITRFEKQLKYFEMHPDVSLISCRMETIGRRNARYEAPTEDAKIRARMLISAVMPHPGFMMRGSLIYDEGFEYDESFTCTQDYDFEARVLKNHKLGMTEEYLLKYRLHNQQISSERSDDQVKAARRVKEMLLSYVVSNMSQEALAQYHNLAEKDYENSIDYSLLDPLLMLYCNNTTNSYDRVELRRAYILRRLVDRDFRGLFRVFKNSKVLKTNPVTYMFSIPETVLLKRRGKIL